MIRFFVVAVVIQIAVAYQIGTGIYGTYKSILLAILR